MKFVTKKIGKLPWDWSFVSAKRYERQKSSLYKQLLSFLSSLLCSLLRQSTYESFLVWKNNFGKDGSSPVSLPSLGSDHRVFCTCPTPLAAGTVDSIIGKLRSIFVQESLGSEWNDRLAIVNPVSHPSIAIRESLRCIREEQAQSRIQPPNPPPPFPEKMVAIV